MTSIALIALTATALSAPVTGAGATEREQRAARGNPTGTAAGSQRNGAGNLSVGLATTGDGRIRVTWQRPAPASKLKNFVVQVGVNRSLNRQVHRYAVSRARQSIVVPTAAGATPGSGNFSYVKVTVHRPNGSRSSSPAKWIQTPIGAPCPAGSDKATVGTFNVRTWAGDKTIRSPLFRWKARGPKVVRDILRSGAHAVAIQEASGKAGPGHGTKRQSRWLLSQLNAKDPDSAARWVDALPVNAYLHGLVGTRVFYDAHKFTKLDAGFTRIRDPHSPNAYTPWARLQGVGATTSPFVMVGTHLATGESSRAVRIRNRQVQGVISVVERLHSRFGGQVILGGDFNSTIDTKPANTVQQALLRAGFYDAFATHRLFNSRFPSTNGFNFPLHLSPRRRDYLMTYGGVQGSCRYVNMAYRQASRTASDHFMQVATLPVSAD